MKNFHVLSLLIFFVAASPFDVVVAQEDERQPEATELYADVPRVTPGENGSPPSDAIVLFDGSDTDSWQKAGSEEAIGWTVEDGALVVVDGAGMIETKQAFGSVQLHVEWMSPKMEGETGQGYANSGVFLMGRYEVQVLNSYDNETYSNGQAASIYKQHIPLVNATRPVEQWQSYDIIFTAPQFSEKGQLVRPAHITVIHNGVLVQNNVPLWGPSVYRGSPKYEAHADKIPLALQDHSDPVRFRNIWIREL